MLKLTAYNTKLLQNIRQILHEMLNSGISVELALSQIADEEKSRLSELRLATIKERKVTRDWKTYICPSCGKRTFVKTMIDGVDVMTCSGKQKCGYSEIVK